MRAKADRSGHGDEDSQIVMMRWDPRANQTERLNIDWSPVQSFFSKKNRNAGFEGVAVGHNRLYVANEREQGRQVQRPGDQQA